MHLADTEHAHLCVGASACAHVFASATHVSVSTWAHIYMWPMSIWYAHIRRHFCLLCMCRRMSVLCTVYTFALCGGVHVHMYVHNCVGPCLYGVHVGICACAREYRSMCTRVAHVSVAQFGAGPSGHPRARLVTSDPIC